MRKPKSFEWQLRNWRGLTFKNPIGISGGVDKNAELVRPWWTFGAGFIEIGTVTPKPQLANDNKILERDVANEALWNYMGFPNSGADDVAKNLAKLQTPRPTPLFANIGKNRTTPNEAAVADYLSCIKKLHRYVDAFVVNISSPNTKDLRDLFRPQYLEAFLSQLLAANSKNGNRPLLLKLSPDLTELEIEIVILKSAALGIAGWVLTNTTRDRASHLSFPADIGGVSGKPLAQKARRALQIAVKTLGKEKRDKLLIASGGIMNAEDIKDRLALGADLVQVYSALVFHGPGFFKKSIRELQS